MNLGDPYFPCKGMMEQVIKGKDYQMEIRKSDGLIVLGAWESHAHGEVIYKKEPDSGLIILTSTRRQVYKNEWTGSDSKQSH